MSASLHPQNGRIPQRGRDLPPGCTQYRRPSVSVARDSDEKYRTPLCPGLDDAGYSMICREEALYVYGERWCDTCRMHDSIQPIVAGQIRGTNGR